MEQKKKLPKILCVDDEEFVLKALSRNFQDKFIVFTADTATKAIEILKSEKNIAILLTDLHMPQKSGMELLKETKEISPNTVRAILSGHVDLKDMMNAINLMQIDRFILKPWDNDYLKLQMLESLQIHTLLIEKNHLQHLATTDTVTGLSNHRFFQEFLQKEVERAARHQRPLSIAMIDVDNFKDYNDTLGHPAGDQALAKLGEIFNSQVRNIDLVSRYGGEEFAIIMPDTDQERAYDVAERVRKAVEANHWEDKKLTISLGVSQISQKNPSSKNMVEAADRALYAAKKRGKNQTIISYDQG